MDSLYHKSLRRLYNTWFGKALWRWFSAVVNHRHINVLLRKALTEPVGQENLPSDSFLVPKVAVSSEASARNVLLFVPFYGPDASSIYVDSICQDFKEAGYRIHAVVYSDSHWRPRSSCWDEVYYLAVQSGEYGRLKKDNLGNVIPDGNHIDDWAGDELVQFAASLAQINNYRYCLVSYVFLSRVFEVLPVSVYKILITHDIFTKRNTRIYETCGSQEGFYFSVERQEERKGLARADLVLAIQEEDGRYFQRDLGILNVDTLPYIPPRKYIKRHSPGNSLIIGYVGSGHRPNIDAIKKFISSLKLRGGFVLRLAGVICNNLEDYELPSFVELIGYVDEVGEFYSGCDVIINPDMLKSGLKIKCVEALSYGLPLVCTEAASLGLSPKSKYHTAGTIDECAALVEDLIRNPGKTDEVSEASRELYERFFSKYHSNKRVAEYEAMACGNNAETRGQDSI